MGVEGFRIDRTLPYTGHNRTDYIDKRFACTRTFMVRERKSSGKSSHWVTVIKEKEATDFWIQDTTGRALVHSTSPLTILTMDARFSSGFLNDASPKLEAFLNERGQNSKGWIMNRTLEYKEGVLEKGESISVVGNACLADYKDPVTGEVCQIPVIDSGAGFDLIVTDDHTLATYWVPEKAVKWIIT